MPQIVREHSTFAVVDILPQAVGFAPAYKMVERSMLKCFRQQDCVEISPSFLRVHALFIVLEFVTHVSVMYVCGCMCTACVEVKT